MAALLLATAAVAAPPNLVFFLTDDQDQLLGGSFPISPFNKGATPLPNVQKLMVEEGATATNFFIHTPICASLPAPLVSSALMRRAPPPGCPSRSETVTGRYLHNVHTPPVEKQCNESYSGQDDAGNVCCMHVDEVLVNNYTMAKYMKEQKGFTSGMFGKYLNNCPDTAQPGWDAWFANGGGNYYNTSFAVEGIEGLSDARNYQFNTPYQYAGETAWPYSTALIGNYSIAWIRKVAKESKPWFAYIVRNPTRKSSSSLFLLLHRLTYRRRWLRATRPRTHRSSRARGTRTTGHRAGRRWRRARPPGTARWRAGQSTTPTSPRSTC